MEEKKIKNLLGPPCGYVDLLDHATTEKLEKDKAEGKDFQKTPVRPSAAGYCTRELFYSLMQFHGKAKYETPVNEPNVHRLLNLGHSIESHIIRQFELLSDLFDIRYKQQVLSFKYIESKQDKKMSQWVEGSLDLVLWSPKWKCVVDIKSKKDKWNQGFKSDWDSQSDKLRKMASVKTISDTSFWVEDLDAFLAELNDPFFEANFRQLNLYAGSDFLKERGVDHGAIIQYNKNDSRLREIRFKPSPKLYKATLAKFDTAIAAAAKGDAEAAPRDYVLGSIKCAFCKFNKECWGEASDPKKDFFATFPKKQWPTEVARLKDADEVVELFNQYHAAAASAKKQEQAERAVVKALMERQVEKVKLADGSVWELKRLKDSVVIRRGK